MSYIITKQFMFSASHQLNGLPNDHPCSRLHGHNYIVELELQSEHLNDIGFVKDYRSLDGFKTYVDEILDHRHLNEVFHPMQTSAENIAKRLFDVAQEIVGKKIFAVKISETEKTWATYRPTK